MKANKLITKNQKNILQKMNKIINILVPIASFTLVTVIVLFIAVIPSLIDIIFGI